MIKMDLSWIKTVVKGPGFPGHFFALVCGALLPFSFEPFSIWPLQFVGVALFYFSLKGLSTKQAMWRGWWFGLGTYAAGVSWVYVSIHFYSHTPAPLAILMTLFFVAGLAWFFALFSLLYQRFFAQLSLPFLSFAALWMAFEWLRSWFLTGFPWLFLGDAHVDTWLSGFAPIFGVYSIGFIVALLSAYAMDYLLKSPSVFQSRPASLGLLISPWILGLLLNVIDWTDVVEHGDIKVAAIQGNIPQDRKWLPEEIYPTLEKYRSASEENWDAQLILWPETAITVLHHQAKEYIKFLDEEGKKHQTALLTGIPYQQSQEEPYPGAYHNTVIALGEGEGIYHKRKLVPFGEYMPFPESWRPLLSFFNIPMSQFHQGDPSQPLLNISNDRHNYTVAPFICYDIVYPDFVANQANDSGLLVTISNDAWFGASIGPQQHLGIARMRALENGRYLLRSTNTGITALIDHKGHIVEALPQFEYGVLKADAQIRTGNTPFNIWGSWPMLIISFGALGLLLLQHRLHVRSASSEKEA